MVEMSKISLDFLFSVLIYVIFFCMIRYLFTLKKYVKNRSRPEGSIEAGYWIEECLTFCSRYLQDVETKSCRPDRNCETGHDYVSHEGGRRLGKANDFILDDITYIQAHRYVLVNSEIVAPFRE